MFIETVRFDQKIMCLQKQSGLTKKKNVLLETVRFTQKNVLSEKVQFDPKNVLTEKVWWDEKHFNILTEKHFG